jgi:hypothetical protein
MKLRNKWQKLMWAKSIYKNGLPEVTVTLINEPELFEVNIHYVGTIRMDSANEHYYSHNSILKVGHHDRR